MGFEYLMMEVTFTINGKTFTATPSSVPVDTSLNTFIRQYAKLPGTKFMCLEGGCGVCIVSVQGLHPVTKQNSTWAVNSCLVNVYSCHGLDITTIEGVGNKKMGYHDIQKRLAKFNGTQCGYCSPGMVMNMYSLLESAGGQVSMKEVENSFGGNICRCTGYRPILDAFKSLAHDADEKLLEVCRDIEDLDKVCPKTGSPCAGKCHVAKTATTEPLHMFFAEDKEWHKVNTVKDIFTIFESLGSKPYMLVAGNTAHGVYRRSPDLQAFIDISGVDELRTHAVAETIDLGGGVTLTETMDILTKASADPKFAYAQEIVKHIDLVANIPVRNIGSLAGNLSIKNQHKEFPSDIFITFEAAGATITLDEGGGTVKIVSPAQFVKEDMSKKVFMKISLPALDSNKYVYRSYKIMPRAQNAHAYVNAAFLLEFDDAKENVLSARICFGGIKPDFVHAELTEKFLVGKDLYNDDVLEEALTIMTQELDPDWVLPDASPDYRKNLALSLFYKFVLNTCPEDKLKPAYKSGGTITDRVLSSGQQTFDTNDRNWPVNKNVPKIEGLIQCSGEAEYTNDIAPQPHEVWAAFVVGTEVHARIIDIDASEALEIPGVVAFYSVKDIPGKNNFMPDKIPFTTLSEELFCSGEVLFNGQPVGIILADSFELANSAAKKVNINYEKHTEIPIVTTVKQALDEDHRDRFHLLTENSEEQVDNGPHDITGRFEIGSQYHYTMETQCCVCIPNDEGMDVYSSTQWIDNTQIAISDVLSVPENSLNLKVKRLGGGYGGKISRSSQIACACALAAHLLNRPVRFVMTLEANMNSIGKRYACINNYEVEFGHDGKIVKLTNDYVQDYGSSLNEVVEGNTSSFFRNCYVKNGWKIKATAAKTDAPSHTWCRAPGTTEGIAMIENIIEHVAHKLEKEPLEVRMANISNSSEMKKMLPEFAKNVDYYNRKEQIEEFNSQNRWRKRGIAIVPMEYALHYFGTLHATVSVYHADGSIAISHGGIEMGQGINTKAAQVVAHILGVPLDTIAVKATNSFTSPNDIVTGGSMTSEIVAYAVKKACEQLLDRMKPIRDEMKDAKWTEITHACYNKSIDLCSNFMYKMGDVETYNIWGTSCVEVELDLLTGNLQVVRADILEDTGESLSPGVDIGQVEGAFIMGLGYWLNESLVYNNENGELLTNRTWTYKPPGAKDIPIDFRITFLQKSANKFGVLRSKATGEPALCMSVVVLFALRHALNSARKDARLSDDWFSLGAPSMPEHLFLAAGNSIQQYKLN